MKIHVVSETEFVAQSPSVHSAFIDHIELLKETTDIDVIINSSGTGDIFHSHTYGPYFFWKGRKYKGKRIHTVHNIPETILSTIPLSRYLEPLARWYFRQVFSYADVCIAPSPEIEKAIKQLSTTTTVVKINNHVNSERWAFSDKKREIGRKLLNLKPDGFVVLGVGRVHQEKGIDDFITVAENIPSATFIWVGSRYFGRLTDSVKSLDHRISHAPKNVKFAGFINPKEMPCIYAASDVLLYPSFKETCPIPPLEAAACGIPIVLRDLDTYRHLFQNRYLKVADNKGFTEVVQNLQNDKEFYDIALKLSKQLVSQFDKEIVRKELTTLYNEIMGKNRSIKNSEAFKMVPFAKKKPQTRIASNYWNITKNNLFNITKRIVHNHDKTAQFN